MLRGFMPCFVLRSTSLHAYLFRSTCLGLMPCFPLFCASICFVLMLGLCAHMFDIMFMVMLCSDLCVRTLFAMFYAWIRTCTCLYAWIHVLPCLCASFHMLTHVAIPLSRSMSSHACVPRSVFYMLYAIFHVLVHSMPCLCA